ncbi:unnamed protein product [marine sediment metagenome]|uniref:Uncharacterized protein n=1 Tax=marine sediment metagenome TaxID=412755 RepID=X1KJ07_9ZZZZ
MGLLQFVLEVLHIGIFKPQALGLAKAYAVDNTGVVKLVADDGIFGGK